MRIVTCNVADLEPHPLSLELFGQLANDRFLDLAADIERRGLQNFPELDWHQRVICGSQRLRALKHLKWERVDCLLREELRTEEEIREFLILDNTQRRQLTPAQMYKAGRELERIYAVQAKETQGIQGKGLGSASGRAAGQVGTSRASYHRLKTVMERGDDELRDRVERGEVSIAAAAQLVRRAETKRRPRKLDPDDTRSAALNFARFEREVEKFVAFVKANPPAKYGAYAADVSRVMGGVKERIELYLKRASPVA